MSGNPLAVQLWTLRNEIAEDLEGTLRRVSEIGYNGVELWFARWPAVDDLRSIMGGAGLRPAGAHVSYLELRDNLDAVVAYHSALGNTDLAIPIIPGDLRGTADAWRERVKEIAVIGKRCREAGMRLSYHNHAVEFEESVDGVEAHDFIFSQVGGDVLQAELDTYFIAAVGKDPVEYIHRYSGRVPLLHVKELGVVDGKQMTVEIGQGELDWDGIFKAADGAGVEWTIVEQNCQVHPALESVAMSYAYLKERGFG